MRRARLLSLWWGILAIGFAPCGTVLAEPVVWSGLTFEFIKPGFVVPVPADQITPNVALTRGLSQGLYNAVVDLGWNGSGPTGTQWATDINNPGKMIKASNYAALDFMTHGSWLEAYGGLASIGNTIEGRDAVVHLIDDDIYLDLRFTDWVDAMSEGGGGGFTYLRAVPTSGDYNGNLVVDAADYVVWQDTFGETVTRGQGADGDFSGTIDAGDYNYWMARFGNIVPPPASGSTSVPVPEPAAAGLLLVGMLAFAGRPRRQR